MKLVFSTDRLEIRQLIPQDWEDFLKMNMNHAVMEKIGKGEIKSIEEQRIDFDRFILHYILDTGTGVWAVNILGNSDFIGAASLGESKGMDELHIGYRLKEEYWGMGYATEIAKGLVQYAFEDLGIPKLGATTNLDNLASKKVLNKVGFEEQKPINRDGIEMNYFTLIDQNNPLKVT